MQIRVKCFRELKKTYEEELATIDVPQGSSMHNFIVELAKNGDAEILEKMMENGKKVHSKIKSW